MVQVDKFVLVVMNIVECGKYGLRDLAVEAETVHADLGNELLDT